MTRRTGTAFPNLKFSERLKQIMSESNSTHQDLANVLGVQRQTVSLYVNGQIRPDIESLAIISEHFNVTADWLLGLTNDRKKVPIATDELNLSEESINKIKSYTSLPSSRAHKNVVALDCLISHIDFEELLYDIDSAIRSCDKVLEAHSQGTTEMSGEKIAVEAHKLLDGTRWTVITSAKYAEYLVYETQRIFNRILWDITDADKIHEIMEY